MTIKDLYTTRSTSSTTPRRKKPDALAGPPAAHTSRESPIDNEKRRRAAEDAEIDAEYERAYAEHPFTEEQSGSKKRCFA